MIKTQTHEETKFLRQILPHYYTHLKENPHSFITHFYGMYRVKIPDLGKSVHFVIMKSVFNTEKEIHKIWDLKGSTLGRRAKRGDGVHKDLDFVDEGRNICVSPETKEAIMDQIKNDADFLARMQIMDYSLLLGVHLCTRAELEGERRRNLLMRTNTPMRREMLRKNAKSTFQQFIDGAKEILGVQSFEVPKSATQSDADTDFNSEKDEVDHRERTRGGLDFEERTALKTCSAELPPAADVPTPYTKRDFMESIALVANRRKFILLESLAPCSCVRNPFQRTFFRC